MGFIHKMAKTINLKNIKHAKGSSDSDSDSSSASYSVTPFKDYFISILITLAVFILFCWTSTSNYLNSLYIDTNVSYPLTPMSNESNPYATRLDPGPVNMGNPEERDSKVKSFSWWWERTQQSSYQLGGTILHYVFDFFKGQLQGLDVPNNTNNTSTSTLAQVFAFVKWVLFGVVSNVLFLSFLVLVFLMWIPGWLGGLTAFMPLTYSIHSTIWQLIVQGCILFFTFLWMCIAGWVTIFPVIYEYFYLLYLMFIKQINDNSSRFGNELVKRMKQLIYLYIMVAVIVAFASELPTQTKVTIGVISGAILLYAIVQMIL